MSFLSPSLRYLSATAEQLVITGAERLLPLRETAYGPLEIELYSMEASLSLHRSLAEQATVTLPEGNYRYEFNAQTGNLDVFHQSHQVLELPLDANGVSLASVRVSEREASQPAVDTQSAVLEASLPTEKPPVVSEQEPNDQLSLATLVPVVESILEGVTNKSGDTDYYQLAAPAGGELALNFTHPNGPGSEGAVIKLALLDGNGDVVSEREFRGNGMLEATLPEAGTFYVRVEDSTALRSGGVNGNVETGVYQVTSRFSSSAQTAYDGAKTVAISDAVATLSDGDTPIAFGATLQGSIASSGDTDVFKLVAESGGKVELGFIHPNGVGREGAIMSVELLNSLGEVISEREYRGDGTLHATVPEAGSYYVRVSDSTALRSGGVNGDVEDRLYTLTTSLQEMPGTAFDAADNSSLSNAVALLGDGETAIAFGDSVAGSISSSGDQDTYRVRADQGGEIVLDVTHPNGPGTEGALMVVVLMDNAGNAVTAREFRGDTQVNASVAEAGDYYVRVYDSTALRSDGVNGGIEDALYHVETSFNSAEGVAYDTANNDTLGTAVDTLADGESTITFAHSVKGSVHKNGDKDVFKLTAEENASVTLLFMHPAGAGNEGAEMHLRLLDSNGESIAALEDMRGNDQLEFSVVADETYYVRVEDSTALRSQDSSGNNIENGFYSVDFLIG